MSSELAFASFDSVLQTFRKTKQSFLDGDMAWVLAVALLMQTMFFAVILTKLDQTQRRAWKRNSELLMRLETLEEKIDSLGDSEEEELEAGIDTSAKTEAENSSVQVPENEQGATATMLSHKTPARYRKLRGNYQPE
jgi:hypothetical protein